MITSNAFAMLLLACCAAACAEKPATTTLAPAPAPSPAPSSSSASASSGTAAPADAATSDGWSAPVDGVRGRFVLTKMPPSKGGPQVQLDLELHHVGASKKPIEIYWDYPGSMLKLSVEDENGVALPGSAAGGSWAAPPPKFIELKPGADAVMRTTVSPAVFEYVPGGTTLFRPLTFQAWTMPASRTTKLYVSGVLTPPRSQEPGHEKAWKGPLTLPRVALP